MSFAQILARLESMNAEISLLRQPFSYVDDNERWSARIEIRNNEKELELKARASGPDVEDALRAAWAKIETIANSSHFTTSFPFTNCPCVDTYRSLPLNKDAVTFAPDPEISKGKGVSTPLIWMVASQRPAIG